MEEPPGAYLDDHTFDVFWNAATAFSRLGSYTSIASSASTSLTNAKVSLWYVVRFGFVDAFAALNCARGASYFSAPSPSSARIAARHSAPSAVGSHTSLYLRFGSIDAAFAVDRANSAVICDTMRQCVFARLRVCAFHHDVAVSSVFTFATRETPSTSTSIYVFMMLSNIALVARRDTDETYAQKAELKRMNVAMVMTSSSPARARRRRERRRARTRADGERRERTPQWRSWEWRTSSRKGERAKCDAY